MATETVIEGIVREQLEVMGVDNAYHRAAAVARALPEMPAALVDMTDAAYRRGWNDSLSLLPAEDLDTRPPTDPITPPTDPLTEEERRSVEFWRYEHGTDPNSGLAAAVAIFDRHFPPPAPLPDDEER